MTYNYEIDKLQYLAIGQQGESNATEIVIDMTSWVDELEEMGYTNPCFHLLFLPYNQTVPVVTSTLYDEEAKTLTWTITSQVTAYAGMGYTEVRALNHPDNGLLKKSRVIPTTISASVTGVEGGVPPAPYDDWLNSILVLINQLNSALNGATTEYAISESYQSYPGTGWSTTMPDLVANKGKYLWTRTTISWSTGGQSELRNVSYIASDADGAIANVNGYTSNIVTLDGRDLKVNRAEQDSPTLTAAIEAIQTAKAEQDETISDIQDDIQTLEAYDASDILYDKTMVSSPTIKSVLDYKIDTSRIVYSSSAPSNPTTGMIWLKPKT